MDFTDFILRIFLAVLFGFLIGLERQLTGHVAGIHTNVLVSLGACIFVLFSIITGAPDITRTAAQIVTGIGFLCSGIIFRDRGSVKGLNTATTIWCTAGIGILSSCGEIIYAFAATATLLSANILFRLISSRIRPLSYFDEDEYSYKFVIRCNSESATPLRHAVLGHAIDSHLSISNIRSKSIKDEQIEIDATFTSGNNRDDATIEAIAESLSSEKGVTKVGWKIL